MIGSYEVYNNYAPFFISTISGLNSVLILIGLLMLRTMIKRIDRLEEEVKAIARK